MPNAAGSGPCRAPGTEFPGQAEQGASSQLVPWAGCWWRLLQAWMKRARPCSGSALGAVPCMPRPGAAPANHFPSFRLAAAHPSCTSVMPAFQTGVVPTAVALLSPSSFQVAFGVLELDFRCFVLSRVQQICSELHLLLCCVLALVPLPPVLLRQAAAPGARSPRCSQSSPLGQQMAAASLEGARGAPLPDGFFLKKRGQPEPC